jgi:hypothetical protein
MRTIVGVLVGLAIVAGGFGVYRWLSGDDARDRAEAAAAEYSAYGTKRCDAERAEKASRSIWPRKLLDEMTAECKRPYDVLRLEPVTDNSWLLQVRDAEKGTRCIELDLARFHVVEESSVYVGGTVEGLSDAPCGPEWWTAEQATEVLSSSQWARERKARLVSCLGEGGLPGRPTAEISPGTPRPVPYFQRFTCRYSSPDGDGVATLRTTGADTFDIANPS